VPFERRTKIARRAPEFTPYLAHGPRKLRQFLGAEHHQRDGKDDNQVWDAEHVASLSANGRDAHFACISRAVFES
jgi:hypothetical protein